MRGLGGAVGRISGGRSLSSEALQAWIRVLATSLKSPVVSGEGAPAWDGGAPLLGLRLVDVLSLGRRTEGSRL